MRRRGLLAGAAASALARPALAGPALGGKTQTLICVPQNPLSSFDAVWTSAQIARNAAFMIFDTLYGRDEFNKPHPQMLESGGMDADAKRWTLRLRDGLRWHDGERVLTRDCAASIRRWMVRSPTGAALKARLDAIETPDDRTLVFRLSKPYVHIPAVLSTFVIPCIMMPERLALTDPFKPIPEAIGSGPFRFLHNEHVQGSFAAFARDDRYVPRDEPPSYMAGGHRVMLDRVEWKMITDGATAANALITGEVDWIEIPLPDLLPMLRRTPGVKTGILDQFGQKHILRPNHVLAPTNDIAIRRALMAAMDQKEIMTAVMGGDPENALTDIGFLSTGDKSVDEVGMENLRGRRPPAEVKAMLDKAGYKGEPLVLLHPTDHTFYNPSSLVLAHLLREAGFTVDDQPMDWGTVQVRRGSREPLDKGGWSIFCTVVPAPDYQSPLQADFMRGQGKSGWFGWPEDARMEEIHDQWLSAITPAEQTRLAREFQTRAFEFLPFIPLGGYRQTSAWRDNLQGVLKGPSIVFWNVTKA
jgi:peptide/nickel transport system substrate-binding protein